MVITWIIQVEIIKRQTRVA